MGCDTSTTPATCPAASANQFGSGIFDVPVPPDPSQTYQPAERVRRDRFGVVGPFTLSGGLQLQDLDNLVYPSTSPSDKQSLLQGMVFFTMFHTPGEGGAPNANGVGPINNQPACIGCHLNAAEAVRSKGLLRGRVALRLIPLAPTYPVSRVPAVRRRRISSSPHSTRKRAAAARPTTSMLSTTRARPRPLPK